jgi:hypothetical protein
MLDQQFSGIFFQNIVKHNRNWWFLYNSNNRTTLVETRNPKLILAYLSCEPHLQYSIISTMRVLLLTPTLSSECSEERLATVVLSFGAQSWSFSKGLDVFLCLHCFPTIIMNDWPDNGTKEGNSLTQEMWIQLLKDGIIHVREHKLKVVWMRASGHGPKGMAIPLGPWPK